MSYWQEQPDVEKLAYAFENVYMLASRKRTVTHRYVDGKAIPIGPRSEDSDWDHVIRFCENAGLRHSIVRTAAQADRKVLGE